MILNLTQHRATPDQTSVGVVDLPDDVAARLSALLTFHDVPEAFTIQGRAEAIAELAWAVCDGGAIRSTMIGGAPFLMGPLEAALRRWGFTPVYSFSRRESVDQHGANGTVTKTAVFRHAGFVYA